MIDKINRNQKGTKIFTDGLMIVIFDESDGKKINKKADPSGKKKRSSIKSYTNLKMLTLKSRVIFYSDSGHRPSSIFSFYLFFSL